MAAAQFTSVENALYLAKELQTRGYPQPVFVEGLETFIKQNNKRFYKHLTNDDLWGGIKFLNQVYINTHSLVKNKDKYSNELFKSQVLFPGSVKEQQRKRDPDALWNLTGGWKKRNAKQALAEFIEQDTTFYLGHRASFNGASRVIPGQINKKLINFQENHLKHNSAPAKIYNRTHDITNDEIQSRRRMRASQYQKSPN